MKTNESKSLTLIKLSDNKFTDDKARLYLERIFWKNGIVCPHCQCNDQAKFSDIAANPAKEIRAGLRHCAACAKQFTVTIGTIFEDSHIPLRKWLLAWYLICSSKKGISPCQRTTSAAVSRGV
jgi:transposase-like protein